LKVVRGCCPEASVVEAGLSANLLEMHDMFSTKEGEWSALWEKVKI